MSATDSKLDKGYLEISNQPTIQVDRQEQRQLVVVDFDNTIFSRNGANKGFYARPYYDRLLNYLSEHFEVALWSSFPQNLQKVISSMFSELKFVWDQSQERKGQNLLHLSKSTKDLRLVWQELAGYDATNTIFLTNRQAPVIHQPYNVLSVSDYNPCTFESDHTLLMVIRYLENIQRQSNTANYMKQEPFREDAMWYIVTDVMMDRKQHRFTKLGLPWEDVRDQQLRGQQKNIAKKAKKVEEAKKAQEVKKVQKAKKAQETKKAQEAKKKQPKQQEATKKKPEGAKRLLQGDIQKVQQLLAPPQGKMSHEHVRANGSEEMKRSESRASRDDELILMAQKRTREESVESASRDQGKRSRADQAIARVERERQHSRNTSLDSRSQSERVCVVSDREEQRRLALQQENQRRRDYDDNIRKRENYDEVRRDYDRKRSFYDDSRRRGHDDEERRRGYDQEREAQKRREEKEHEAKRKREEEKDREAKRKREAEKEREAWQRREEERERETQQRRKVEQERKEGEAEKETTAEKKQAEKEKQETKVTSTEPPNTTSKELQDIIDRFTASISAEIALLNAAFGNK